MLSVEGKTFISAVNLLLGVNKHERSYIHTAIFILRIYLCFIFADGSLHYIF